MDQEISYYEEKHLLKLTYKFNAVPMKILTGFFWVEFDSWS